MPRQRVTDPGGSLDVIQEQISSVRNIVRGLADANTMMRYLDGEIHYWSRGSERLYGFNKVEAIGARADDLLTTEYPQSVDRINDELVSAGAWQGELSHRHRDGHTINVASHWVLLRHAGSSSVIEVANDITRRVTNDTTGLYYTSLVENSDDAIIGKDLSGIVKSWNPAAETILRLAR